MELLTIHRDRENDNSDVDIYLKIYISQVGWVTLTFTHSCDTRIEAGYIANQIREDFDRQVELIRQAAYNQGWEDKLKKRPKKDFFGWCFNKANPWKG